jgi:hypothetical protein
MTATITPGSLTIPSGIFTSPGTLQILVTSTSMIDTGTYTISLTISDPEPASITSSFTV